LVRISAVDEGNSILAHSRPDLECILDRDSEVFAS